MHLGEIIKKYREEHDRMSMDTFAIRSGLSKGYISMLESNKNPKTGKPITPSLDILRKAADGMMIDVNQLMDMMGDGHEISLKKTSVRIPVLGAVPAGIPIEAIQDIVDYEEIDEEMAASGEFFGLKIKGTSMEPRICDGDVVIVKMQSDVESGDTAIILVNGEDATCKRLMKYEEGISLLSNNPTFKPMYFSENDIKNKPIVILGKVVELRGKV